MKIDEIKSKSLFLSIALVSAIKVINYIVHVAVYKALGHSQIHIISKIGCKKNTAAFVVLTFRFFFFNETFTPSTDIWIATLRFFRFCTLHSYWNWKQTKNKDKINIFNYITVGHFHLSSVIPNRYIFFYFYFL